MSVAQGRHGALLFLFLTVPVLRGVPFTRSARTHPAQLEPWSARTHHLPLRRLAPVSRSAGVSHPLSLSLSLVFFPAHPLLLRLSDPISLCSPSLMLSLCLYPCVSIPLSHAQKKGFGLFGASQPPPGFEPSSTGQKRCGVSTGPRRWVTCTMAPWHHGTTMRCSLLFHVVMHIFFRMGVCSAVCRGTAQRPREPGPPA